MSKALSLDPRVRVLVAAEARAGAVAVTYSTLGPVVDDELRAGSPIPLFRIERGTAALSVKLARRIDVLATLRRRLEPTTSLLDKSAAEAGANCEISQLVCEGTVKMLMACDKAVHADSVLDGFTELVAADDLVVLAQASISETIVGVPQRPYFTSPEIGMDQNGRHLSTMADRVLEVALSHCPGVV
ncbi:hypothetical protein [Aestuariivirga sp.]|uniref:hypothetical protein n=1 Tax=Aestuariivirga sp. TaxID=2650926 RepID=UPI003BAD8DB5